MNEQQKTINQGRKLKGVVISDAMNKTRVVAVARLTKHPQYHKYITRTKHYKAHDEENIYKKGDEVIIKEGRPLSKDKRWRIVELVKKAHTKEDLLDQEQNQETPEEALS